MAAASPGRNPNLVELAMCGLVRVGFCLLGSLPAHTLGSYGRAVLFRLELRWGC